jgi:hypothetical protein
MGPPVAQILMIGADRGLSLQPRGANCPLRPAAQGKKSRPRLLPCNYPNLLLG